MDRDPEIDPRLEGAGNEWRAGQPDMPDQRIQFVRRANAPRPRGSVTARAASAAVVVVVAIVVAIVFVNRPREAPVAFASPPPSSNASATQRLPASQSPTASPENSPSSSPTLRPEISNSPVPVIPTPPPTSGWTAIGQGADIYAVWSPDGAYVALETASVDPTRSGLAVLGSDGVSVASYDGFGQVQWLSDSQLIALSMADVSHDNSRIVTVPAILVDAITGNMSPALAPCCINLGNGNGAIAVARYGTPEGGVERPSYKTWTTAAESEERDGLPAAWSTDGTKLAVIHPMGGFQGADGWLEVVAWPSLQTLYETDHSVVASGPTFDPSGQYIEFQYVPADGSLEAHIVDIASGGVGVVAIARHGSSTAWDAENNLLVAERQDGTLSSYAADGSRTGTVSLPVGSVIDSSAGGSTLLSYLLDSPTDVSYTRAGGTGILELPTGTLSYMSLSPDGAHLVVVTTDASAKAYLAPLP